MDTDGSRYQVEEGAYSTIKRDGLNRIHTGRGDGASFHGDRLDPGGGEGFVDFIAKL